MDAQPNRGGRRRRRRKAPPKKSGPKVEPIIVAARRPDSPRLEKPTRRMKAASAKPRAQKDSGQVIFAREVLEETPKKRRDARIVVRKEDDIDDRERERRKLLSRYLASEGRAAITHAADLYFQGGFALPLEQNVQLKLLEHFDEMRAKEAIFALSDLIDEQEPQQLHVFRQRLRRLEDHAEDESVRSMAAQLRRSLPA